MTFPELVKLTAGRFMKVAETADSIVVGILGSLTEDKISHEFILHFARYYCIATEPDRFQYHFITAEGAVERGCKLPDGNYNGFIEIFKN